MPRDPSPLKETIIRHCISALTAESKDTICRFCPADVYKNNTLNITNQHCEFRTYSKFIVTKSLATARLIISSN